MGLILGKVSTLPQVHRTSSSSNSKMNSKLQSLLLHVWCCWFGSSLSISVLFPHSRHVAGCSDPIKISRSFIRQKFKSGQVLALIFQASTCQRLCLLGFFEDGRPCALYEAKVIHLDFRRALFEPKGLLVLPQVK